MARSTTFTSYVNMEPAKGVDAALAQLERKANAAFSRISMRASAASSATNGARGVQTPAQIQTLVSAERRHAQALQQTAHASNQAAAASSRLAGKHMLESNAARAAAASTTTLERSLRLASVAANVAQGPLGPLAGRLSAVATAVRELSGIRLGLVGAGALSAALVRSASSAQELKSKLYPLFDSQQQVNAAFRDTIRIANDARLSLEPVVDLYARLTLGGRDVGISQQRIARVTEIAAKAARLSGGTGVSQDAGLYQFAQGLGSGNLAGDELKSVRENTLRLAKAIADGMGVSIAELKRLGKEGKLTAEVVATALETQAGRIDAELARLPATISASTARLSTAFLAMVNGGDEAYGVTRALAGAMGFLADNLGNVVQTASTLAIVYASIKAVDMARSVSRDVAAWNQQRAAIAENRSAFAKEVQERTAAAATARTTSAERIMQLRSERTELQTNADLARRAERDAFRARNDLRIKTSGGAYAGRALDMVELEKATQRLTSANTQLVYSQGQLYNSQIDLHRETQVLNNANTTYRNGMILSSAANGTFVRSTSSMRAALTSLRAETGSLVLAKQRLRAAMDANSRSANIFRSAGRALWGVIGPNLLGLAVGLLITALLTLKNQTERVAAATDHMAEREAILARMVDLTTGAIKEQNSALLENERLKARGEVEARRREFRAALVSVGADAVDRRRGATGAGAAPKVAEQLRRFQQNPGDVSAVSAALGLIARNSESPAERRAAERAISRLADTTQAATNLADAQAQERLLLGVGTAADRARFSGEGDGTTTPAGQSDEEVAAARRDRSTATRDAAEAERELQQIQQRTDTRSDILSRYEEQSTALRRAAIDTRRLLEMVGKEVNDAAFITADNPLGRGIYTEEMATADRARIDYGVRQPIRDAIDEQQRSIDLGRLRLDGYEMEAAVLERALSIQDNMGEVTRQELEQLLANERTQLRINDALESRARQMAGILDAANSTRDAFENMLLGLSKDPVGSVKNFGKQILGNIAQVQARQLTERLFAGADEKLRQLIRGSNGVDRAAQILADSVRTAADPLPRLGTAATTTAEALEAATARINASVGGTGAPGTAGSTSPSAIAAIAAAAIPLVTSGGGGLDAANDNADPDRIVVTTPRRPLDTGPMPTGLQAYSAVFEAMGENLDRIFKSGTFFSGIGKGVGKAIGGAQDGMMASGVLRALGVKQSQTGAAIGGALGSLFGPAGGFIGGAIGGTVMGALKKAKTGSATIGQGQFGYADVIGTGGNNAAQTKVAQGLAGSVNDQLNQIADAFGAQIGAFSVSIGKRNDDFIVNGSGGDATSKKSKKTAVYVGTDEEGAIAAAVQNAIEDGAITGISAAAQKILKSGQNLQTAITKAVAIESISKRLMAKTDPVRYAVTQLNEEFTKLIAYLKEGGATAEQFADAQKLYELERVEAINQATQQSVAALQAYMDEMMGGASSPFNKRTVYENAAEKLASFRGDIASGKAVDQNDLLTAARNFQDASRALNGSSEAFFNDFNDLFQLLTKARDNAGGTAAGGSLPDSPFNNSEMSSYLSTLNQTTATQTEVLAAKLDSLIAAVQDNSAAEWWSTRSAGAMYLLPGYGEAA